MEYRSGCMSDPTLLDDWNVDCRLLVAEHDGVLARRQSGEAARRERGPTVERALPSSALFPADLAGDVDRAALDRRVAGSFDVPRAAAAETGLTDDPHFDVGAIL